MMNNVDMQIEIFKKKLKNKILTIKKQYAINMYKILKIVKK